MKSNLRHGSKMKQSKTYYDLLGCKTRVAVFQGGTRSGKTWSILTCLIQWCYTYQNAGYSIDVIRESFPSLRASVMRDFFTILTMKIDMMSETTTRPRTHITSLEIHGVSLPLPSLRN